MSDVKIIVFDLDETLLDNQRKVTDFTLAVLNELRAKGHKLVINTARSTPFQKEIFDIIKPDYSIVCGGAAILDGNGEIIYERCIDAKTAAVFISELYPIADNICEEIGDICYCTTPSVYRPNDFIYDFSKGAPEGKTQKILAATERHEDLAKLVKKYGLLEIRYHNGYWRRIGHPLSTKEEGLFALQRIAGFDPEDVIAFGDDHGDVGMIRAAGIGVLMKNANEELYPLCPCISEYTNDEDGVARFLKNLLL